MHCTLIFLFCFITWGFRQMYLTQFLSSFFMSPCPVIVSFFRRYFFFLYFVERSLFVRTAVYRNFSSCSNLYCPTIWQICVLCCQGNEYTVCNYTRFLSLVFCFSL
uniref:Uncharacterized protein n=1 Tax=Ixodes scapularis TaxID=6945 RepID=A0A4D5RZ03_IXOSC